jgi:hypothetical protein
MEKLVLVILNLVALSALLYFFDYPYRRYRERALRDHIFCVRDELFSAAERGLLSFDNLAYTTTRRMLNGMIRYAHTLSVWRVLVLVASERMWREDEEDAYFARYAKALDDLSTPARQAIDDAMTEAHLALLSHLLHTSLFFLPGAIVGKYVTRIFISTRTKVQAIIDSKLLRPTNSALDREAYLVGC